MKFDPFGKPFIMGYAFFTEYQNHARNRSACEQANHYNAIISANYAKRGMALKQPYYHYDALTGRALVYTVPHIEELRG
jgi:hypothetical protein